MMSFVGGKEIEMRKYARVNKKGPRRITRYGVSRGGIRL